MITDEQIKYLVKVLRCAVTGEAAPDIPPGLDVERFMNFCRFHKVDNIVYMTVGNSLGDEIKAQYEKLYNQMVMVQAFQQHYLEKTEKTFEENGIDYLVLKGRELARLYPLEVMRQSSDFDIYIRREDASKAKELMLENGFKVVAYSDENDDHDEYSIHTFVLCELHRVLIQSKQPWQEECNNIPERLIRCEGTKHCYRMSDEDFYVYNLAHAAKHIKYSGIGIRVILDQWLIAKKLGDTINWNTVDERLKRAGLCEFNRYVRELYLYWFEGIEPSDKETIKQMERYVVESGWLGTYRQARATEVARQAGKTSSKKVAKLKTYFEIIWVPYEKMAERYPILKQHCWLLPVCRLHKLIRAALFRRETVKSVSARLDEGDMDYGKKALKFQESIGL